jgi:hypothetical protein
MTTTDLRPQDVEAKERLAAAAGAALLVAGLILVTVVLPAEYGIDRFGTAEMLGLMALSEARSTDTTAGAGATASRSGPIKPAVAQSALYKVDSIEFRIGPREGFEYKYRIEKDGGMVYAWMATGTLQYELHGEPDGAAPDVFESYEIEKRDRASGSFVAPFSGIHGWYWENQSDTPVTLKLTAAGFFSSATEYRDEKPLPARQLADVPR